MAAAIPAPPGSVGPKTTVQPNTSFMHAVRNGDAPVTGRVLRMGRISYSAKSHCSTDAA